MATWHDLEKRVGFGGFGKIDPYIDWAFGSQRRPLLSIDNSHFPLLLTLRDGLDATDFANGSFFEGGPPEDWAERVFVPEMNTTSQIDGLSYFTALVTAHFFDYFDAKGPGGLLGEALMVAIVRMAVSRPVRTLALPQSLTAYGKDRSVGIPPAASAAPVVVIGVIDDGLAIANASFRTADDRTRIEAAWMQDGVFNDAASRYGFGRVLQKHGANGIDAALAACWHGDNIDEDEVYARLGLTEFEETRDPVPRTVGLRASHGTHVMDLACGSRWRSDHEAGVGAGDDHPIVCVQLPAASEEGTSGASLDTHVFDGIRFILEQSDAIARRHGLDALPVVINVSFGTLAGRHDGTSDLELAIDELIRSRSPEAPLQVVIPAGNGRLARCHAAISFASKPAETSSTRTLSWRVLPDDRTTSHLEIWLPQGDMGESRVSLEVTPPNGETSPPCFEDTSMIRVFGASKEQAQCYIRYCQVPAPTGRGMFLVTLRPTALDDDVDLITAAAGIWSIRLKNHALGPDEVVHVWIQRDDTRYGHPVFGRQSHFEPVRDVPAETIESLLDPSESNGSDLTGTLNGIATGQETIVVGGFRMADFGVATYSGAGPVISRKGPDALAPSDRSRVRRGLMATGTRSGSKIALSGTSVAAPLVTRLLAQRIARGESADKTAIAAVAAAQEAEGAAARPSRPDPLRGGAGRILVDLGCRAVDER